MYIMDDVLDLMDTLGETLEKGRRTAKRLLRGQSGFSTLVTVLVIMALGAIVITPVLAFVVTGQRAGSVHKETTHRFYAADTGIQDGMWRVSSGDLPDEWKGTWDDAAYDDLVLEYALPNQVNGNDVMVKIRAMWLLAGLETPANGREPHGELVTVSNITGAGHMQVVVVADSAGNYKLDRIGVWIPQGFEYTVGSSTLEQLPASDPAHCHPTISDWKNGHTVIFDYGTAVDFADFPGVSGNRMVLAFDYTPGPGMTTSWSWCRTNRHDIYLSYSGDIKMYQIESTATNPVTGASTTVIAGNMTNESIGTYLAYYGDYAVTGNAIMRDQDAEGHYRERLYEESPGEITVIPESGTARRILLYWSGWKSYPDDVYPDDESNPNDVSTWSDANVADLQALAANYRVDHVSLRAEFDGTNYDLGTVDATEWTVLPNGSYSSPNGWSYGCQKDITDLVMGALPSDFVGNAKYWVGHAATGAAAPSDDTLQGIWGSTSSNVFIVGDSGTIVRYDGILWSTMSSGITRNFKGVWGNGDNYTAGNRVYAVGERRNVRMYDGTSWTSIDSGTSSSPTLYGVWGTGSNYAGGDRLYVAGTGGTIRSWNNSTWSAMTSGTTQDLRGIWGSGRDWAGGNRVYAVGTRGTSAGTILQYNGSAWGAMSGVPRVHLYGVWGSGTNWAANDRVYAVGASGTILSYNGTSWSTMGSGTTEILYGVWGTSATDVYAVGASGTILHYTPTTGWQPMTSNSVRNLYGAWGTSTTNIYVVGESTGTASTILHYDGLTWTAVAGGTPLYTWVNNHSGETTTASTDFPLSDIASNEWQNAAWSVLTLYTSPVTLAHQMYLFDTFGYWNSNDDKTFTLDGFLAPAGIASESDAVKVTCFVGEGDSIYTGDNIYLNGTQLNTGSAGTAQASNNVWNGISSSGGVAGYPPGGLDLDTFTIDGHSGIIDPADSSATVRLRTGTDVWNLVYMILSFRSDIVGSGLMSYIVK
jgi:hypothetical protein